MNYWNCGEWIGIGPGAHSRVKAGNKGRRSLINEYDPNNWGEKIRNYGYSFIEDIVLTDEQNQDEYIVMSMRTKNGLNLSKFQNLGGKLNRDSINSLIAEGYLITDKAEKNIKITNPIAQMIMRF